MGSAFARSVKNYADRRWYYSSYNHTQNPDPLISDCYYSMKGANVIDFFVYPIEEAWDQAPPWRKEAEKRGQIGKTLPRASPCPDYLSRQFFSPSSPNAEPVFRRQ